MIISIFLIIISFFLYYQTITLEDDPATLPRLMLIVIIFLSILMIIKDKIKKSNNNDVKKMSRQSFLRIFIVTCIIFLYVNSINLLGFYISTLIFLIIVLRYIGEKNKLVIFGVPILFLIFLYLTFSLFLHVDIPLGIFFR